MLVCMEGLLLGVLQVGRLAGKASHVYIVLTQDACADKHGVRGHCVAPCRWSRLLHTRRNLCQHTLMRESGECP